MGDAIAHLAGADHADRLDVRHEFGFRKRFGRPSSSRSALPAPGLCADAKRSRICVIATMA
jgi:hypothetical protein